MATRRNTPSPAQAQLRGSKAVPVKRTAKKTATAPPAKSKGKAAVVKPVSRSKPAATFAAERASVRFFLADDVRQELSGKVTAVGLYADNVIVAEMSPDDPDPTPDGTLVGLAGVVILANIIASPGDHEYQLAIEPTSVVPAGPGTSPKVLNTPREGSSVNMIMRLAPLPFFRFGPVNVLLRIDGKPYRYSFEIRRRNKAADT